MSELEISPSRSEDLAGYQRTRRKRLASRGDQFYENIDENNEIKQCPHCKRNLSLSKFLRNIQRLDGYSVWCLECRAEYQFLYRKESAVHSSGYFCGTGICLICGEVHPLKLEVHHLFGSKNSGFCIHICGSCHNLLRFFPTETWNKMSRSLL